MPELALADASVMSSFAAQNGGQPNTLNARFYEEAVLDERATNGWDETKYRQDTGEPYTVKHPGAGFDKFRPAIFVEIGAPGDTRELRRREMRPTDKHRFAAAWERFQKGISDTPGGTPIEILPGVSKSQAMELKGLGIHSIENLRDCSDANGQKIMAFASLRNRASDYLLAQEGAAPAERLRKELEQRDAEINALKAQMADVIAAQAKKKG